MTVTVLSSTDVLRGTGITYRQLDHWSRVNAIQPTKSIYGSGDRRTWTGRDRLRLKAIGNAIKDVNDLLGLSAVRGGSTDLVRRIWNELEHTPTTTIRHGAITITVTLDEDTP